MQALIASATEYADQFESDAGFIRELITQLERYNDFRNVRLQVWEELGRSPSDDEAKYLEGAKIEVEQSRGIYDGAFVQQMESNLNYKEALSAFRGMNASSNFAEAVSKRSIGLVSPIVEHKNETQVLNIPSNEEVFLYVIAEALVSNEHARIDPSFYAADVPKFRKIVSLVEKLESTLKSDSLIEKMLGAEFEPFANRAREIYEQKKWKHEPTTITKKHSKAAREVFLYSFLRLFHVSFYYGQEIDSSRKDVSYIFSRPPERLWLNVVAIVDFSVTARGLYDALNRFEAKEVEDFTEY